MHESPNPPEIIAIASGKGGTGKTLLGACFGFALARAKHRVLLVDADPGTDGLSLFLLGPKGMQWISAWKSENTFRGALGVFKESGEVRVEPRRIERSGDGDHGCFYNAVISGRGLYGDLPVDANSPVVPDLDQVTFRRAINALFNHWRSAREYDYIIVDTRGGFAFESTDICAAADSFLLVTDPDYTSFHQNRNLVARISAAAAAMQTKTLLRAILVNRAMDGEEKSFRLELEKEFPVRYSDTFAIPLDVDALKAYRMQQVPYIKAPASGFGQATLSAFADILQIVTAQWPRERVDAWNALVREISVAIERRNAELEAMERAEKRSAARYRVVLMGALTALMLSLVAVAFLTVWSRGAREPRAVDLMLPSAAAAMGVEEPVASPPSSMPNVAATETAPPVVYPVSPPDKALSPPRPTSTAPTLTPPPPLATGTTVQTGGDLLSLLTPRGMYSPLEGKKTASGKPMFHYTVWLDVSPALLPKVSSVRYHFNHSSFATNNFVGTSPSFAVTYDGWGCVSSVTATLTLTSGPPQTFEFDQCAAIKGGASAL